MSLRADSGPVRPADLPFKTLRPWMLETFGRPVYRVALDAGSTCPNRDGSKGKGGCIYCDVEGSGTGALRTGLELAQQLESGIARVRRRDPDPGVLAYFQSYSNTYVERARLEEVLGAIESYLGDPVVAVSIATRPDTLPDWSLDVLSELAERVPVWVELGLEAADDGVLERIRRYHTVDEFRDAVDRCHERGFLVVGHAILGLPGDGRAGAARTGKLFAETRVSGVKVHNLMVLARTQLAHLWRAGEIELLGAEEYVQWLADFVEQLRPEQVLHRITGDAPLEERLAPRDWPHKNKIRDELARELIRRGI